MARSFGTGNPQSLLPEELRHASGCLRPRPTGYPRVIKTGKSQFIPGVWMAGLRFASRRRGWNADGWQYGAFRYLRPDDRAHGRTLGALAPYPCEVRS